jgi:hypothetical protein
MAAAELAKKASGGKRRITYKRRSKFKTFKKKVRTNKKKTYKNSKTP